MGMPENKSLEKMRSILEKADPTRTLPEKATVAERVKYQICEKFVSYLLDNELSQAELARQLNIDRARLNEIVKYKIHLFTIDKLVEFAEKLDADFRLEVA